MDYQQIQNIEQKVDTMSDSAAITLFKTKFYHQEDDLINCVPWKQTNENIVEYMLLIKKIGEKNIFNKVYTFKSAELFCSYSLLLIENERSLNNARENVAEFQYIFNFAEKLFGINMVMNLLMNFSDCEVNNFDEMLPVLQKIPEYYHGNSKIILYKILNI